MIEFTKGNIFDSLCEALVNTVNVVGVAGKGLALQFRHRYPLMYRYYREACLNGKIQIGSMWLWSSESKLIINFPTKQDWRNPSKIEYIVEGLKDLRSVVEKGNIKSLAIPALGCQNGKLSWEVVKPLIEDFYKTLPEDFKLVVYEPKV